LLLPRQNVRFSVRFAMTSIPVTKARSQLYQLLDAAAGSHEPIQITGKRSNAVLVSEEDWRSIQETLYLISIPGMRDSIRKGMAEPLKKALKNPSWRVCRCTLGRRRRTPGKSLPQTLGLRQSGFLI